jgi:hypothetical protein
MISQMAKEIDKTKNTLKVQQEKIQSDIKSTKAEIIFAAAAEYAGKIPDLSFTKLRPEISQIERRMSLRFVKAMSKISTGISLMVMI